MGRGADRSGRGDESGVREAGGGIPGNSDAYGWDRFRTDRVSGKVFDLETQKQYCIQHEIQLVGEVRLFFQERIFR